jgi:hypothetical protein
MKILKLLIVLIVSVFLAVIIIRKFKISHEFDIAKFQPIPDSSRAYLIDKIHPSKNYKYWECVFHFMDDSEKGKRGQVFVYNGDTSYAKIAKRVSCDFGFFPECHPGVCFSYIIAISDSNVIEKVDSEAKLKRFIGDIDNIEEAILVSKIYGFWYDSKNAIGGSYRVTDSNFLLYLLKYSSTPVTYKSVRAILSKKGEFKVVSKKVYKRTKEYYLS